MELLIGFAIAMAIALTGVGAGSMTTPILILFLRVPPAVAVGTALTFGAIVKVASIPTYAWRRQVNFKILGMLLAGGIPGVLIGSVALNKMKHGPYQGVLYTMLGAIIALTAALRLYRTFKPKAKSALPDRTKWLPWFALPIGAEVGFFVGGSWRARLAPALRRDIAERSRSHRHRPVFRTWVIRRRKFHSSGSRQLRRCPAAETGDRRNHRSNHWLHAGGTHRTASPCEWRCF